MAQKIWFAEKQNGEILELTELEALTQFEDNNISRRMRLRFLGTSDGTEFEKARKQVLGLMQEKRAEQFPSYQLMNAEEKRVADFQLQAELKPEIRRILDEGKKAELENAKKNGVQQPDKSLRIITQTTPDVKMGRNQILNNMNI